ncbi:MAG TPA: hypothetical protein VKV36_05180 [Acidimicrobiales bacterium]|nr:hypothetical protein [Acidimicrobiales bacterium]
MNRYEHNNFPASGPDPAVLASIVHALGHSIEELPEEDRRDVIALRELLTEASATGPAPSTAASGERVNGSAARRQHSGGSRRRASTTKSRLSP